MRIAKGGNEITCIGEWKEFARPKSDDQWVEGRSAYELARAWCGSGSVAMPSELRELLDSREETREMAVELATPEHQIVFDECGGEPRHADLAFIGQTPAGKVAVTIEAKADEPFGGTVAETLAAALERLVERSKSQGVRRVEGLVRALFAAREGKQPKLASLRYQLLTATAGTLAYAVQHEAHLAVLIVHEFMTTETRDELHAKNSTDYRAFLDRLGRRSASDVEQVGFQGPFAFPGLPLFDTTPRLLIGKITARLRPAMA